MVERKNKTYIIFVPQLSVKRMEGLKGNGRTRKWLRKIDFINVVKV
jgi:hypothetical protein